MSVSGMLDYLKALEANNNRDWYHAHRREREEAVQDLEALIRQLSLRIAAFDGAIPLFEPGELTFKLNRDTRFSRDKSPYNPAFRAHIAPKGKLPVPVGYYLMIKPGDRSFLGGGLFADMFKEATDDVRAAIAANGGAWERILADPVFAERFAVGGTALKNAPKGYDPAHPQAAYLKHKSWYLEYPIRDEQLLEEAFPDFAAEIFRSMQPFNAFLNRALEGFRMPER